jgi:hypothetical protein
MSAIEIAVSVTWGFLVGFVGWGSCFRLPEPIATWLTEGRNTGLTPGIVRLAVVVFLVISILVALALPPIFIVTSRTLSNSSVDLVLWRNAFGFTFVSSLLGLFALGLARRLSR